MSLAFVRKRPQCLSGVPCGSSTTVSWEFLRRCPCSLSRRREEELRYRQDPGKEKHQRSKERERLLTKKTRWSRYGVTEIHHRGKTGGLKCPLKETCLSFRTSLVFCRRKTESPGWRQMRRRYSYHPSGGNNKRVDPVTLYWDTFLICTRPFTWLGVVMTLKFVEIF